LANFHATFLGEKPENLWKKGTYWHLDTRPDELKVLKDTALKKAAGVIDQKLQQTSFKTFVHGDAKLANFCFSADGKNVAAVDFQYVGGGCGMKDVAYFIGSCLHEEECESWESDLLDIYFIALRAALDKQQKPVDADQLEKEWRSLYPLAWTDFHRFLKGWSPGHWKINSYSERLTREVIDSLHTKSGVAR
jgi:thiamine kinase-like enzyme